MTRFKSKDTQNKTIWDFIKVKAQGPFQGFRERKILQRSQQERERRSTFRLRKGRDKERRDETGLKKR